MVHFDRDSEQLAHFLAQTWHTWSAMGECTQVHTVAANLEGDAARWLVSLHEGKAPELGDLNAFMQILCGWFKYPMAVHCAETHIHTLKQGKWPVVEYIQDFCS